MSATILFFLNYLYGRLSELSLSGLFIILIRFQSIEFSNLADMEYIELIIDFVLHIDVYLANLTVMYGPWIYAILFLVLFCETGLVVTPFLPGDSLLFVAGTIATLPSNGLNVHLLACLLTAAAILGDGTNFYIGRYFGERMFSKPDSKIFKRSYLDKTHSFYEKHGGKTIVIARFVPIIRTFAPFVAGMGKMHYRFFLTSNVLGGMLWVCLFVYAGYFFGELPFVKDNLHFLLVGIIFVSLLPAIIGVMRNK